MTSSNSSNPTQKWINLVYLHSTSFNSFRIQFLPLSVCKNLTPSLGKFEFQAWYNTFVLSLPYPILTLLFYPLLYYILLLVNCCVERNKKRMEGKTSPRCVTNTLIWIWFEMNGKSTNRYYSAHISLRVQYKTHVILNCYNS